MCVCYVDIYLCILMVCQKRKLVICSRCVGSNRETDRERKRDTHTHKDIVCMTTLFTPVCDCDKLIAAHFCFNSVTINTSSVILKNTEIHILLVMPK